ncbi:MAG: ribosome assembly RNA-binding protein YhbY [Oligoflexus sp.]
MKLNNKQKKFLKGKAHDLPAVVYVGNNGISEGVLREINQTLDCHELIKIKVRCDDQESMQSLVEEIQAQASANLVQVIGHTVVLYRAAKEPQIQLPRS